MSLSIGEVVARSGLSHDTLRYYDREGLLPATQRSVSGHRRYPESVVDQIQVIASLRAVGFSLAQVRTVLAVKDGTGTYRARVDAMRAAITSLESSLDDKERALQEARGHLQSWREELDAGEPWPDEPIRS